MNEQVRTARARARLYQALSDALDSPIPDWLSQPGSDNPLMDALAAAARELGSSACRRVVQQLVSVPAQDRSLLRARHTHLLVGPGRPLVMPYESWHRDGQMVGPASLDVGQWYEALGAEPAEGELPDHLCMELAFLAYLYRQEAYALEQGDPEAATSWRKHGRWFLRKHPAKWMPQVGDALAEQGDLVFGPLGYLLAEFIREEAAPHQHAAGANKQETGLPSLMQPELCSLCGFCVQVCAPKALYIHETGTDTHLMLSPDRCTSCGACPKPCPDDLLSMSPQANSQVVTETVALRTSPRVACPACGRAHVSEAELEAVIARLEASGALRQSLSYCVDCKAGYGARGWKMEDGRWRR